MLIEVEAAAFDDADFKGTIGKFSRQRQTGGTGPNNANVRLECAILRNLTTIHKHWAAIRSI